jgi:hypothetical protein
MGVQETCQPPDGIIVAVKLTEGDNVVEEPWAALGVGVVIVADAGETTRDKDKERPAAKVEANITVRLAAELTFTRRPP